MVNNNLDLKTAIASLARNIHGSLRAPDSDGYNEDRTGFQLLEPHQPAVLVEASDTFDVRAAVEFAASRCMTVAVQATGHGRSRAMDDGVLINTRRMCGVDVNPQAETAWVEAGANWQHVIDASTPHGLAPLSGSLPTVGAVSYTLGGGIGLMARRYGFAADHVHRLEVVTTDGLLRQVSATEEPDLFWALRGGGGNFGVVTGMEIALMPVTRLYGGILSFDLAQTPDVLNGWRKWTATVPDEMTSAASVVPFPDLPMVPEPMRGRHVAQLQISYAGPVEHGKQLVDPLRALGPILQDTVRDIPYSESGAVFDEPDQPSSYRGTSLLLDDFNPQALTALVRQVGPTAPLPCVIGLRHLGGALAQTPQTLNAVGHRSASYSLGVLSLTEATESDTVAARHRDALARFAPNVLGRSLNFTFGPLDHEQVRAGYGHSDYQRLTQLKNEYDPHTLLYANHSIPPQTLDS